MLEQYKNKIICGDCLEVMKDIPNKSIDMILCDLPYGTTACSWDTIIPFEPLWIQYKRIIKDNGAIVLTASQPFTSKLVMSNLKMFRYEIIWNKVNPTGFFTAKIMPMKIHENICVFYKHAPTYNKQMKQRSKNTHSFGEKSKYTKVRKEKEYALYGRFKNKKIKEIDNFNLKNPDTIIRFSIGNGHLRKGQHPTQKPLALFKYLIKTYTNEGDLVLDNCIGSGTTAVAAKQLKRNFIGIEISEKYCEIARQRLRQEILI